MIDEITLKKRLSLPYELKVYWSKMRLRDWIDYYGLLHVHQNNSGGKDSQVVRYLLKEVTSKFYPNRTIPQIMVNTLNENPHNLRYMIKLRRTPGERILIMYPQYTPEQILDKWGYPVGTKTIAGAIYRYNLDPEKNEWRLNNPNAKQRISKKWRFLINSGIKVSDYCCYHLKVSPLLKYARAHKSHAILGIRVEESKKRKDTYKTRGCNAYNAKEPQCWPIAFWTAEDVNRYIKENNVEISKAYETEERTGCMFCLFGIENDLDRFVRLRRDHPKWYNRAMRAGYGKVLRIIEIGLNFPIGRLTEGE